MGEGVSGGGEGEMGRAWCRVFVYTKSLTLPATVFSPTLPLAFSPLLRIQRRHSSISEATSALQPV